jgi:hypothetical protein
LRLATRVVIGLAALLVAPPIPVSAQTAQHHLQLALGNYALSTVAQFAGKVIAGENVLRAARRAPVEALAPTGLQHAGMTLLGQNWRLAVPAQALVQKGVMLQRRSMLGQPMFDGFWTSWELDYLWLNLRLDRGRLRLPRVNVETVRRTLTMRHPMPARFDWSRSFATGVPTRLTDRLNDGAWGQEAGQLVDLNRFVMNETWTDRDDAEGVYRHELEHTLQSIRGTAMVDVILRQDAAQSRPLEFLRWNAALPDLDRVQAFLVNGNHELDHDVRFIEWEADAYAGRTTRSFRWR